MIFHCILITSVLAGPYSGWNMVSWEPALEGGSTSGSAGGGPQIIVNEKSLFNEVVWGSDFDTFSRINPATQQYEEARKENANLSVSAIAITSGTLVSYLNWKHEASKFWYIASIQSCDLPDGLEYKDFIDKYRVNDNQSQWPEIYDGTYEFQIPVRVVQPVTTPPVGPGD